MSSLTPERRAFLQKHGPIIEAMVQNQALMASIVFISQYEITKLREESVEYTLNDNPHAAKIAAAKSEGIFDFIEILQSIAKDYGTMKTSRAEQ